MLGCELVVELKDGDPATVLRFELFEQDEPEFLRDAGRIDLEAASAVLSPATEWIGQRSERTARSK